MLTNIDTVQVKYNEKKHQNTRQMKEIKSSEHLLFQPGKTAVFGFVQQAIRLLMWCNIFVVAFRKYGSLQIAFHKLSELKAMRDQYRNNFVLRKFIRNGLRFYASYNIPAWPSNSFNRYVSRQFTRLDDPGAATLHTIIFGITKKCGFQCEHCYEWEELNKPETLSKDELLAIVNRFHQAGVSQIQLTGGEPLNRFNDLLYVLQHSPSGIDYWLYTTGFSLTYEKAKLLQQSGLAGITVSLDHHLAEQHDHFRGVKRAFEKALTAVANARKAGLPVCFSLCATKEFISNENLYSYATLAKDLGVSFIQILEPRAVGHYAGKDVQLNPAHYSLLNTFYETINYNKAYARYPIVAYPGYYGRNIGCSGGGVDYLYVDTDGDVHNCPFCRQKLFSSLHADLDQEILQMRMKGCNAVTSLSAKTK